MTSQYVDADHQVIPYFRNGLDHQTRGGAELFEADDGQHIPKNKPAI